MDHSDFGFVLVLRSEEASLLRRVASDFEFRASSLPFSEQPGGMEEEPLDMRCSPRNALAPKILALANTGSRRRRPFAWIREECMSKSLLVAIVAVVLSMASGTQAQTVYTLESPGPEPEGGAHFGYSVSRVGPVDGDWLGGVIVGAYDEDGGATNAGRAHVFSGEGYPLCKLVSPNPEDDGCFGYTVSGAGNVDGYLFDDVIVGAYREDGGATDAGRAYLFTGNWALICELVSPNPDSDGYFGRSVSGVGNVNNDDYDDVIVGAPGEDGGATNAGRTYVFSGGLGSCSLLYALVSPNPESNGYFGRSVSGAGDVNSDGSDDVIVGAYGEAGGATDAGRAYIFSGNGGGLLYTLQSPNAESFGYFGRVVSGAGDVNDDGHDDVIVGAYREDGGATDAGRAYVFSGNGGGLLHTLASPSPEQQGFFGSSVSGAGDVNDDGYDDAVVGAQNENGGATDAGRAYIFSGNGGSLLYTLTSSNPEYQGHFGCSVSGAGDTDEDGYDDVIAGAYEEDVDLVTSAGRAYVLSGNGGGLLRVLDLSLPEQDAWFGYSVSGAGDINNDGYGDAIVGAYREEGGASGAGRSHIFSGNGGGLLHTLVSPNPEYEGWFGKSVSGAGDVNNDGYDEVVVGAYWEDGGALDAGRAHVFSGNGGGFLHTLVSPNPESSGHFGRSVSSAGDANNDGYKDIIVGAYGEADGAPDAGRAYIFSGNGVGLLYALQSPNAQSFGYFGLAVSGAGDVNNDGYDDVLVGAYGEHGGAASAGRAYVFSGDGGGLLHTLVSPNPENNGFFGCSVSCAGDQNSDGYDDVLVGAYGEDGGAAGAGRAYVFSGDGGGLLHTLVSPNPESNGFFGYSVSCGGDQNNDGYDDVLVGAVTEDGAAADAGRAYIFSGNGAGLLYALQSPNAENYGLFGFSVSGTGDANDDGYDDVIVGAYAEDGGAYNAGRAYIFITPPTVTLSGALSNGQLVLDWTVVPGASRYWLYGARVDVEGAYFEPQVVPPYQYRLFDFPYTVTTHTTSVGIGNPALDMIYLVVAVDASYNEICRSNRVGEREFSTVTTP